MYVLTTPEIPTSSTDAPKKGTKTTGAVDAYSYNRPATRIHHDLNRIRSVGYWCGNNGGAERLHRHLGHRTILAEQMTQSHRRAATTATTI